MITLINLYDQQENNRRFLILAGIFAALTAWTKNEGWLIILAAGLARSLIRLFKGRQRQLQQETTAFFMGAAPILIFALLYKFAFSPGNDFVHEFLGAPNILECEHCTPIGNDLAEVKTNGISVIAPYEGEHIKKISIMPSEIFMSRYAIPGPNVNMFRGKIISVNHSSTVAQSLVEIENGKYSVELPIESCQSEVWKEGTEVFVKFRLKSIRSLTLPQVIKKA